MARIRTIKPEFWTSEQVMECSPNARLLFIGLWNFADDRGRMALSPKRIKAQVFPSDDFTSADVRRMIDELTSNGLLRTYVVDDDEYLAVTGWHHQKIDRPQDARTPEPPDGDSPNGRRTFGVGREGKGEDRKGKDPRPGPASDPHPASRTLNAAPAEPAPTGNAGPGQAWATRENFDRIEARCREALPDGGPQDLRIGPIAKLVADELDLEAEIIPNLLDVAAAARVPIRTWSIYADRIAERVTAQRAARTAQGLSAAPPAPPKPDEMVDLGSPYGAWGEQVLRLWITKHRTRPGTWQEQLHGPPPGAPGCRIPARLLIAEAA